MADFRSTEQAPPSTPGDQRYERYDGNNQRSNGVKGAVRAYQEQFVDRLGQFWQAAQVRLGLGDNRQPTPKLSEELRHGQQEAMGIGQDLADIGQDLKMLVQQEMVLARAEMKQQLRLFSRAMVWGSIALVLTPLSLVFLALAGMFALALVMPFWASALIMAGAIFAIGLIAGLMAYLRFRQVRLVPQRTMESVKEDIRWISGQLKSNGK